MNLNKLSYISIDPSLRSTGIYSNGLSMTIATKPKKSAFTAKENIYYELRAMVGRQMPDICFIEDYSYGSAGASNAVTSMAEVRGLVLSIMIEYGVPLIAVPIQMWKSVCKFNESKKGKGWKENYLRVAEQKSGIRFNSPDEVDAYFIYETAMKVWETGGHTEAQKRLFDKIQAGIESGQGG